MKNIKILGAGLSGLTTAINLAKNDYNVEVFEKAKDSGTRFHNDLQGLENWSSDIDIKQELESMNIKFNFEYNPFKKMSITDGKEVLSNTSNRPFFYIVGRGTKNKSLDQSLKNQAIDCDVKINFGSKVKRDEVDIISTGISGRNQIGVARGICFETKSDDIAVALINKETAHNGYSYLLISNGKGTICSINFFETGINVNKYYKKTFETISKLFEVDIKNKRDFGGIGCFLIKPKLIENGRLFTGEAAGLQDFLWGFGMRYAITSGFLAARSIIENKNYKNLVNKNLSRRLKTSIVNRYLAEKIGDIFYNYLINQAKENKDWLKFLHDNYNSTFYKRIIYPFAKNNLMRKYKKYYSSVSICL